MDSYLKDISYMNNAMENDNTNDMNNNKVILNRKKKNYNDSQRNFGGDNNSSALKDPKLVEYFNKNLIQRKEIKNAQIQDSINLMRENQFKKKGVKKAGDLKYVKDKK